MGPFPTRTFVLRVEGSGRPQPPQRRYARTHSLKSKSPRTTMVRGLYERVSRENDALSPNCVAASARQDPCTTANLAAVMELNGDNGVATAHKHEAARWRELLHK